MKKLPGRQNRASTMISPESAKNNLWCCPSQNLKMTLFWNEKLCIFYLGKRETAYIQPIFPGEKNYLSRLYFLQRFPIWFQLSSNHTSLVKLREQCKSLAEIQCSNFYVPDESRTKKQPVRKYLLLIATIYHHNFPSSISFSTILRARQCF